MKIKSPTTLPFLLLAFSIAVCSDIRSLSAQTVIGGLTIDPSAMLDVQATDKGILPPRLTSTQRDDIGNPANGLLIFNTTLNRIQINMGTPTTPDWRSLGETFPPSGNQAGDILFWNGSSWVLLNPGLPGQTISLSANGTPIWSGVALPTLSTQAPSGISPVTAVLGGQITADGGAAVTARGVVWGTTPNPTLQNNALPMGLGTGTFSNTLSGLMPNTTYYVRAYATNSSGTAYGNEQSFSTLPLSLPTISTNAVSAITPSSAVSGGFVANDGGALITQRGVAYSTSPNPTVSGSATQNGTGPGNFSSTLSGLTPNTTYFVRAYATNSAGTAYGNELSFLTQVPSVPSLTTADILNITHATASSGGTITNDGGSAITARGVVWATAANPTLADNFSTDGAGTGSFSSFITGLAPGTTYFVRAYATNSSGTGYGNQLSLTTAVSSSTLAEVQTLSVSGITLQQATVNAEVLSQGGNAVTERGIVWNADGNPTVNSNRLINGTGTGAYATNITGLTAGSTYFVRAYAVNSFGIAYGAELSFTMEVGPPIVNTSTVLNASLNAIYGGGEVTDSGGFPVTARGLVYGTAPNPGLPGSSTSDGTGLGAFNSSISGLSSTTTYFVRAYATNSAGTGYGAEYTVTTAGPTPDMTDIDGNNYPSVQIGQQIWTSTNLRTARYRNGDPIPYVIGNSEWQNGTIGMWSYYNHDEANNAVYGKLYNGYAVADPRGLCPTGWHVPDETEMNQLINYLGGTAIAGGKMKLQGTDYWNAPNTGATNSSGFSGLPGGERTYTGSFNGIQNQGFYWSTVTNTLYRLFSQSEAFEKSYYAGWEASFISNFAKSVRCIKNSPPTLQTNPVVEISNGIVSTGGNSLIAGGEPVTAKGIAYSTTPTPFISDNFTADGSGTDDFFSVISGLVLGTTYYFRAYATNSLGTGYGSEVSFTPAGNYNPTINISGGSFRMGCTLGDTQCEGDESPNRTVNLSAFEFGDAEVTQFLWQSVMGSNPSFFDCPSCPVEQISWYDAIVFCNRFSELNGFTPAYYSDAGFTQVFGKNGSSWTLPNGGSVYWNTSANGYRLPTEAEWEYAGRGGNPDFKYSGSNDINQVAWYNGNSGGSTRPVKGKQANGFNLFDFSGNVWEWCWDFYGSYPANTQTNPIGPTSGSNRIFRGGSWGNEAFYCRISERYSQSPATRHFHLGFRLARTP